MATWKNMLGAKYSKQEEEYIRSFDFDGGGCYGVSERGVYHISYIARETKLTIVIANTRLWFMWLKRKTILKIRKD